jgi:hypothetical protein
MSEKRVVWANPDGSISVLIPAPGVDEAVWRKDIPQGVTVVETTADKLPQDRMFRKAWKATAEGCFECPVKAKEVAHEIRRAKREEEFAPHDAALAKAIPGKAEAAEAERQKIRDKYAGMQTEIDSCVTTADLRRVLGA